MSAINNIAVISSSRSWDGSKWVHESTITVPTGLDYVVVRVNANFVSAPTFGGVAMTEAAATGTSEDAAAIHYVSAPEAGDHVFSGSIVTPDLEIVVSGVTGSSGLGATYFSTDTYGTGISTNVTTAESDAVFAIYNSRAVATAGAGQAEQLNSVGATVSKVSASTKIATGTSTTMAYTHVDAQQRMVVAVFTAAATGPDYTARKGSTETITHTLTADGITTATLNGETVTIGTQSGQDADIDLDETAITTSGEYDLVLGDGVGTETFTVQYNVIGLPSNTLLKDGAALASLTDVKLTVLDASGTRLDRQTGLTTDASGLTGVTPVAAGAVDDPVEVSFFSPGSEVGIVYETTLELL